MKIESIYAMINGGGISHIFHIWHFSRHLGKVQLSSPAIHTNIFIKYQTSHHVTTHSSEHLQQLKKVTVGQK
jgi:hypothetical protein